MLGEFLLRGKVRMLTVVAHGAEVVMLWLRQVMVEPASDMHGQSNAVSVLINLKELVIVGLRLR